MVRLEYLYLVTIVVQVMSNSLPSHGLQYNQASLSLTISQSLLKFTSTELVIPSNHLILCRPFLLPSVFPSVRVFSNESILRMRWPKYWNFSFSIIPSNEHPRLISFKMDWLDLLGAQLSSQSNSHIHT